MGADERINMLTCTLNDGHIVLDEPADWPDGCRVTVEPLPGHVEPIGITEEQWPRTADAIAEWLEWFDSIEPVEYAPEEEADHSHAGACERGMPARSAQS
jgi:hypothetical protein